MAGDWIKMRSNLWDDPRIARIVDMTDAPEAQVIGSLYWLWAMADQHSEDGYLPGLSLKQIDRKTGTPGFGAALVDVGWLADGQDGVTICGFDEHNGASAKKRCQTAKRVAVHAAANAGNKQQNTPANADPEKTNAGCVSSALAREREREEVNNPPKAPPAEVEAPEAIAADAAQAVSVDVSRCRSDGKTTFETWYRACQEQGVKPLTEFDALWRYAEAVGLSRDLILLAWVRFKEHYSNDEKGRRKRYKDWRAVFLRSTKECWHRLWVIRDGSFVLTTVGQQAMRELEVAA